MKQSVFFDWLQGQLDRSLTPGEEGRVTAGALVGKQEVDLKESGGRNRERGRESDCETVFLFCLSLCVCVLFLLPAVASWLSHS